jgi:hypothetical protein
MKHQSIKFLITICATFICTYYVWTQYAPPVRIMSIPPTIDKIVFDGIDNESSYGQAQTVTIFNPTGYSGENDFSGYFKVCWDTRFLYFYANITDDVDHSFPNADVYDTWMYDNIEIYLDLDTTGSESFYTDHTIQLRYNRGWNRVMWSGRADGADYFCYLKNKPDSTGWVLETGIPWSCVLPTGSLPQDINEFLENFIGFDACFSDSDGENPLMGMRDVMAAWDSDDPDTYDDRTEDNAWNNRKVFGIVKFLGEPLPAPIDTPPPPPPPPPFITPPPLPPPVGEIVNYVQPIATMTIPATIDTINFDGIDNELSYGAAQTLTTFNNTGVNGPDDFSGYFKVCWDSTYLYFFANITDDVDHSNLNGGNDWEFDNMEIFIDLDTTSVGTYYDDNTSQIRLNRGWQRVSYAGRATADNFYYYSANKPDNEGWIVETAIPWISALPSGSLPEDILEYIGNSMGFDVMGADSDGEDPFYGMRDGQSAWDMDDPSTIDDRTEDNAWNNTRVFGIIELLGNPIISPPTPPPAPPPPVPDPEPPTPPAPPATGDNFVNPIRSMHIPQTIDSMSMDGIASENSYSDAQTLEVFNGTGLDGTPDDFDGIFKVCWDYRYLYFFADITDDINHSVLDENNVWMFDNIELYLDLAIDSSSTWYDDNAIQIRFNRGIDYVIWPGRSAREEYIYYWKNKPDSTGWIVETAVPWTTALPEGKSSEDIADYIHNNMGFDVIISDSDGDDPNYGMRDAGIAWDMDDPDNELDRTEDNAWNNTHVFGVVNLLSDLTLPEYRTVNDYSNIDPVPVKDRVQAYPNPTSGDICFENLNDVTTIEILNILGQKIQRIEVTDKQMNLNLTLFSKEGVLITRYIFKDGSSATLKLILK